MATPGDAPNRYESSAGELSSPPSGSLSEPTSPSRRSAAKAKKETTSAMDQREPPPGQDRQPSTGVQDITTVSNGPGPQKRYGLVDGQWVQLTAAGLPRKKPGRKPGAGAKAKPTGDSSDPNQQAKVRRPRKVRDADTPPLQRKRKLAPADDVDMDSSTAGTPRPLAPASSATIVHASQMSPHHSPSGSSQNLQYQQPPADRFSPTVTKREDGYPGSMRSILNADPPSPTRSPSQAHSRPHSQPQPQPSSAVPKRSSGQNYDPIRGNYDPVRETMVSHNPYASSQGSPRAPSHIPNRSPSIASLIEPITSQMASPGQSHHTQARLQKPESSSVPPSPSHPTRPLTVGRPKGQEAKKESAPPPPPPLPNHRPIPKESQFTTIANGPIRKTSDKQKPIAGASTPKTDGPDEAPQEGDSRSILDFGKARPGEETVTPTIVLSVPIQVGETNKYVNFMRLAEDRYGWDALHPRLAANRDRKARIAAAAASLEKTESGRESGDEMSVDLSEVEGSNPENGGTSGPDAQEKPEKKKRIFKEDQYDVGDDFVDDSEMLWEAQAAASRDGFFVYSGPLVPEEEKPAESTSAPAKRGRGGGRGSRGGSKAATRGESTAKRGGGPGSRGGVTRKPRGTKSERAQREKEKADKNAANGTLLQPVTPSFTVSELGA